MRHGKSWTNASYRYRLGCDSQQARRQLQELVNRGYAEARGQRGSTSYVLASDGARPASGATDITVPAEISALTTNAPAVWTSLEAGPRTRQQIVEATRLSPRQVTYALKRLEEAGFVEKDGRRGDTTTTYHRA